MTRISAGSTLANQFVPPFVVSDNVASNWRLRYNSTLLAFEAFDPDENVVVSGFDTIEQKLFSNVTNQQVFVLPWVAASEQSLYITINGVKQHTNTFEIAAGSSTTTVTLGGPAGVGGPDDVEFIGLQASAGATLNLYRAPGTGTRTIFTEIGWHAPSEESLLITIDGIRQHTDTYSIESNAAFTNTDITFVVAPTIGFTGNAVIADGGTGYTVNDVLTVQGGTGTAATITVNAAPSGIISSATVLSGGAYSVLPGNPVLVTGGTGGDDATFTLTSQGQDIEVVGITTTGEAPTSIVEISNLAGGTGANPTLAHARIFSTKILAGTDQKFTLRDLFEGANITLTEGSTSITIAAIQPTFNNLGSGAQVIAPVPGTTAPLDFHSLTDGNRIIIALANGVLTWSYDTGYVFDGSSVINAAAGDRLIGVTNTGTTVTVNLLAIAELPAGDTITIKDESGGAATNNITIQTAGEGIDSVSTTHVINTNFGHVTLYSNGSKYFIIAQG